MKILATIKPEERWETPFERSYWKKEINESLVKYVVLAVLIMFIHSGI